MPIKVTFKTEEENNFEVNTNEMRRLFGISPSTFYGNVVYKAREFKLDPLGLKI